MAFSPLQSGIARGQILGAKNFLLPTFPFKERRSRGRSYAASLSAVVTMLLLGAIGARCQSQAEFMVPPRVSSSHNDVASAVDSRHGADPESTAAGGVVLVPSAKKTERTFRPFRELGFDWHSGLGGVGFDIATPLAQRFNLRVGSDFFSYGMNFQEQGANVGINLRMRAGHASLDWFPFGGRLRLSPMMVFANNNRVLATALIPSGSSISLNGQNYISSYADPLHGAGSVDFRKFSPGFTLGSGDIIPRTRGHLSVPIELGFYYVGQPGLKVNFSGSACDPSVSPTIGCEVVTQDSTFQQNLVAFTARNNHNLSYLSLFPVFSVGFGYAF